MIFKFRAVGLRPRSSDGVSKYILAVVLGVVSGK